MVEKLCFMVLLETEVSYNGLLPGIVYPLIGVRFPVLPQSNSSNS